LFLLLGSILCWHGIEGRKPVVIKPGPPSAGPLELHSLDVANYSKPANKSGNEKMAPHSRKANPSDPYPCASEGGKCVVTGGPLVVEYSYENEYSALLASNTTVPCNNDVFSDIGDGYTKQCYVVSFDPNQQIGLSGVSWSPAGSEGTNWLIDCPAWVRFGYDNQWTYRLSFGWLACNTDWFNFDPSPGNTKICQIDAWCTDIPSAVKCAQEDTYCNLEMTAAYSKWIVYTPNPSSAFDDSIGSQVRLFGGSGAIGCNNDVFGDPAKGPTKYCYLVDMVTAFSNPTGVWSFEGMTTGGTASVEWTASLERGSSTTTTSTWTTTLTQEFGVDFEFADSKTTVSISESESTSLSNSLTLTSSKACSATCPKENPFVFMWKWLAQEQCDLGAQYCELSQGSCFFACQPTSVAPPCPFSACQASDSGCACGDWKA